ncbi:MAG: cytochrome c biogenesis protein CcsA [Thermacetogeniaceae bacterium]
MASFEKTAVLAALIFYAAAALTYFLAQRDSRRSRGAFVLAGTGLFANLLALIHRAAVARRLPLANGYEFLLCFTLLTASMYISYEAKYKDQKAGGPVMIISALLLLAVALLMPEQFNTITPLMPALKSPWLAAHVLTAVIAYSSFALATGLAAMQLRQKDSAITDDAVYRSVAIGFAMLSLSIVLGAIWAEQAWGSYWSWDPKEIWALITWIIYAIYLHMYRQRGLRGKSASFMVIAGFILVLFTFFGVNYLMSGLHSYASL